MIRLDPPREHVHYSTTVIRTTEPYESPSTGTVYPVCRDPLCEWRLTPKEEE